MIRRNLQTSVLIWLRPGAHLKRWLALAAAALIVTSLGVGIILADLYRAQPFPEFVYYLTLQFVPRLARGLLLLTAGFGLGCFAWFMFSRSLLGTILPGPSGPSIQAGLRRRHLQSGPRIVAIGGGTGLSTLLKGLKEITSNITAIVTVADDGGSSGRLRRDLGILPPGDFRQCIAALADAEPLMGRLLQHRFSSGDLKGHSFGNLFLTAMAETVGSFDQALVECSRVLAVRGRIIPSTLANVTLCAELEDGRIVRGESALGHASSRIHGVFLDPPEAPGYPEAIQAIREADAIIIGPGSLYTSILPNLLVPELASAYRESKARKLYVCNVATEPGETTGYRADDFLAAIKHHVDGFRVDCVLANTNLTPAQPGNGGQGHPLELVRPDITTSSNFNVRLLYADVISEMNPSCHDSQKLALAISDLALH